MQDVPELCQQFGCRQPVQTWCPFCRAFFCHEHDQLYPVRRHDCLRGNAELRESVPAREGRKSEHP